MYPVGDIQQRPFGHYADMTVCPYCAYEAAGVREEIAHMQVAHPEVIRQRLKDAGLEPFGDALGFGGKPSFDPDWTIAPGETLRDWISENGLTVRSTATACGRMDPERLQAIVDGNQPISEDDATRLQVGTGITKRLWINLERRYRDDLRRGKTDVT